MNGTYRIVSIDVKETSTGKERVIVQVVGWKHGSPPGGTPDYANNHFLPVRPKQIRVLETDRLGRVRLNDGTFVDRNSMTDAQETIGLVNQLVDWNVEAEAEAVALRSFKLWLRTRAIKSKNLEDFTEHRFDRTARSISHARVEKERPKLKTLLNKNRVVIGN